MKKSCLLHIRNKKDILKEFVTALTPESESLTLKPGEYRQNPITLVSDTGDPFFSYESSDEDIATVDEIGVIHALSPGTCLITVTCEVTIEDETREVETAFTVVVGDN